MTSTPPICFTGTTRNDNPARYRKSHRLEVHRSADKYLADLEAKEALNRLEQARKPKPSLVFNFLKNFGKGLEIMFGALHLRP